MVERGLKNLVPEWCGVGQSGTVKRKDLASFSFVLLKGGTFFLYYKGIFAQFRLLGFKE